MYFNLQEYKAALPEQPPKPPPFSPPAAGLCFCSTKSRSSGGHGSSAGGDADSSDARPRGDARGLGGFG